MLLAYLLVCQITTLVTCNPFHKYPFVFLLDIGNEELERTSTEQIRISAPGGSIALRYPAVGEGDTISHVRVSGIDFGTDLKVNVVDGGPGSKYAVLVFSGNVGVPYDAVLTINTLPDEMGDKEPTPQYMNGDVEKNDLPDDTPNNEVAEDDDVDYDENGPEIQTAQSSNIRNAEIVQQQSTSNDYDYSENEVLDSDDYDDEEWDKNPDSRKNTHNIYRQIIYEKNDKSNVRDYNIDRGVGQTGAEGAYGDKAESEEAPNEPRAEPYSVNSGYIGEELTGEDQIGVVDNNLYDKYKALKPHLYNDVRVYPQEAVHDAEIVNSRSDFNTGEDPVEIDQMFNDEEIHNDADKFKDTNNNYFDSDDSSAVAY